MAYADELEDPIGYEMYETRDRKRQDGTMFESFAIRSFLEMRMENSFAFFVAALDMDTGEAVCEVCGVPLGPYGIDNNHHRSLFGTPAHHFCAEHCPACSRMEPGDAVPVTEEYEDIDDDNFPTDPTGPQFDLLSEELSDDAEEEQEEDDSDEGDDDEDDQNFRGWRGYDPA